MEKRIETIDDLADIAGAELGRTKKAKKTPKSSAVKKAAPQKTVDLSNAEVIEVESKARSSNQAGAKSGKTPASDILFRHIDLAEIRGRANPISNYVKNLDAKTLEKRVNEESGRAERLKALAIKYDEQIEWGGIGYHLAAISVERDVDQMRRQLELLAEKA